VCEPGKGASDEKCKGALKLKGVDQSPKKTKTEKRGQRKPKGQICLGKKNKRKKKSRAAQCEKCRKRVRTVNNIKLPILGEKKVIEPEVKLRGIPCFERKG